MCLWIFLLEHTFHLQQLENKLSQAWDLKGLHFLLRDTYFITMVIQFISF